LGQSRFLSGGSFGSASFFIGFLSSNFLGFSSFFVQLSLGLLTSLVETSTFLILLLTSFGGVDSLGGRLNIHGSTDLTHARETSIGNVIAYHLFVDETN